MTGEDTSAHCARAPGEFIPVPSLSGRARGACLVAVGAITAVHITTCSYVYTCTEERSSAGRNRCGEIFCQAARTPRSGRDARSSDSDVSYERQNSLEHNYRFDSNGALLRCQAQLHRLCNNSRAHATNLWCTGALCSAPNCHHVCLCKLHFVDTERLVRVRSGVTIYRHLRKMKMTTPRQRHTRVTSSAHHEIYKVRAIDCSRVVNPYPS